MPHDFKQLVNEVVANVRDGAQVTVCTATERVTLVDASAYELDDTVLEGRTVNHRGVLIPASAIQLIYFDGVED